MLKARSYGLQFYQKTLSSTRPALSRNRSLSEAFCRERSIPLVTSRKVFGLESLFIANFQAFLVTLYIID